MLANLKLSIVVCTVTLLTTACSGCIDFNSGGTTLSITEFHFASEIRDMGDYDAHSQTYTAGEQIFMYFELEGFEKRDDGTAQVYQTLTVITPSGTPFIYEGVPIENYTMIDQSFNVEDMNVIWFDNHLPLVNASWATGTYTVKIMVEDRVAHRSISYDTDFVIVSPS